MNTLLAIDLGKLNSVFCWYEPNSKTTESRTVPTCEDDFRQAFLRQPNVTVVVEAWSPADWVHDLAVIANSRVKPGFCRDTNLRDANEIEKSKTGARLHTAS
jgi:hypothetical protein